MISWLINHFLQTNGCFQIHNFTYFIITLIINNSFLDEVFVNYRTDPNNFLDHAQTDPFNIK